jgi:hypothetical protein
MIGVRTAWKWILGACILAIMVFVYFTLRARGKKGEANEALADGIDAISLPAIERKRARLTKLEAAANRDAAAVAVATAEVEEAKKVLKQRYDALDLTPEQVAERFKNLSV